MFRVLARGSGLAGILLLVGVYACDAGHGFVKDDFNWIQTSRIEQAADLSRLLGAATGFFRPLVSLSFAIDYALFDLRPLGYGLTNLVMLLGCVGMVFLLLRASGIGREVAGAVALLWALNFHGINMAVLWISGRTALLVTLFAVAAAAAWMRGCRPLATILAMAAMWSKEEAFALPAIFTAWSAIDRRGGWMRIAREAWPLWLVAGISLVYRAWVGAYTPGSAPPFYRYQSDLATLTDNILAYADRSATTPILALLLFWVAAGRPRLVDDADAEGRRAQTWSRGLKAAVWTLLAFAPTILLPVRSSLYAVLPSIGLTLIVADLAERMVMHARPAAINRAVSIVMITFLAFGPVYRVRNLRYVREAELSAAIVKELQSIAAAQPAGGLVVIRDARDVRPTAEQALGGLGDLAAQLVTNGALRVWIEPAPIELASVAPPDLRSAVATLVVEGGGVRRAP
jgi:hypothetical protein